MRARRGLAVIGMVLLFGGWSCQTGYTGQPGHGQTGHSGQPPKPLCLQERYPSPCPLGD